jgi:hypothetical protein
MGNLQAPEGFPEVTWIPEVTACPCDWAGAMSLATDKWGGGVLSGGRPAR